MDALPAEEDTTKSSFLAMGGVLFSRASGVLRTIIVNSTFGAATVMDAFNAAFRLPNSLRDLFADGALSSAFMTALVAEKQKGIQAERQLIAIVFGFFGMITFLIAIIGLIFSSHIMDLITEDKFKLTGGLPIAAIIFQFLIFYLPLTMINAVIMAILGVHGRSFRAMNGSFFLSVGMILGALVLSPISKAFGFLNIYGLAVGALLGAFFQMVYQMHPLIPLKLIPFPNLNPKVWWHYQPLKKILVQITPRALGQGALIIALSINTYFATQIGVGYLTYIVTAVTIIQVPIGLFGVATSFAALPALTFTLNNKDTDNFSRLLTEGLRTSFWLATFTTLCFALLILPFYIVLFQHGKITYQDTINNSIAICVYATGVILASGNKVLINTLYALQATSQIVYNAIIYLIINTCLNIIFVPKFGLIGIGCSFGIATSVDFWLNFFCIKKYFHRHKFQGSPYQSAGSFFACKILLLNGLSFILGLSGVWLINHLWQHLNLHFWSALLILSVGGFCLVAFFILIVIKVGPSHIKNILAKFIY
jgi:putative peptidoglycan lipid II flippase